MKEITENKKSLQKWINPTKESLWSKLIDLSETLLRLEKHLSASEKETWQRCKENLENARACFDSEWWRGHHHHHLAWEFMHRVDEDIILLLPEDEIFPRSIEVKTCFDLNVTEKKIREEWLGKEGGEKGKLLQAVKNIESLHGNDSPKGQDRHIVKLALRIVNKKMDRVWKKIEAAGIQIVK